MARLAREAVILFHNLEAEIGIDGGFHPTGFTQLVPPDWVDTAKALVAMHQSLGVDTDFVDEKDWETRFPWLEPGKGWEPSSSRQKAGMPILCRPQKASSAPTRILAVTINPARRFEDWCVTVTDHRRNSGNEEISTAAVVNAAGPWSTFLAKSAEIDLPIRAVREQDSVWEVRPDRALPTTPVSNPIEAPTCVLWVRAAGFSDGAIRNRISTSIHITTKNPPMRNSFSTCVIDGAKEFLLCKDQPFFTLTLLFMT
ncbi:MAG: hypothetical protein CM1200mP20_01120 [Pseudomonadota bacterium]|nr:MAG: hypothetical protein CM1200mP20_01120 [Pseudomonadota bacterium]